uniref:Uncharacterized protein n=1 Tax=Timema bartmani TaxID=61472 RepID=A0A7R9I4F1_9NEOP|nr:unnamed protein product [Timema bartmani]
MDIGHVLEILQADCTALNVQDFNLTDEDVDELNALGKGSKGRMFRADVIPWGSHPEVPFNEPY